MERIEFSLNDIDDLLHIIKYAKGKYLEDRKNAPKNRWDDSYFYVIRIEQLEQVLKGKNFQDSIMRSSIETLDSQMTKEEKARYNYRKKVENSLYGVFDD